MEDGYLAKIVKGDGSQGIKVGEVLNWLILSSCYWFEFDLSSMEGEGNISLFCCLSSIELKDLALIMGCYFHLVINF